MELTFGSRESGELVELLLEEASWLGSVEDASESVSGKGVGVGSMIWLPTSVTVGSSMEVELLCCWLESESGVLPDWSCC